MITMQTVLAIYLSALIYIFSFYIMVAFIGNF